MPRIRLAHSIAAVIGIIIVVVGVVYINQSHPSKSVKSASTIKTVTPNLHLAIGGWLPYWDDGSGLNTFKTYSKSITELHPFSYQATSATNIELEGHSSHNDSVQAAIKKTKSANIPTLTESLNTADFTALLNDPVQRNAHAGAVCNWVNNNNFDGVDIDYEVFVLNLSPADAPAMAPKFTALMSAMATCLHEHKKTLEVTVLPRTGDPRYAYFESHLSVPVFDYAALGKVADYINPMAYDFSYPGSSPGSTDPIEWVKAVVKYTTDRVDPNKVQLALPLYGYNWMTKGTASTASNSAALAAKYHVTPTRDPATQSLVFTYTDTSGNNHTVWYDDAEATALRVQVARDNGLHGVLFWTLGDEEPGTFGTIVKQPAP